MASAEVRDALEEEAALEGAALGAAANEASRLQKKSTALFESGQAANANSDSYVFDTAILALVLFFASTARQIVSSRARAFIICTSFLLFFWSVVRVVTSPVTH
jgi:hypothetical protein